MSCNVTFAQLGIELGNGSLAKQAERARFNRNIPLELPLGVSSFPPGKAGEGETAQRAIGQGQVLATPMQMALVTAGIAGGGVIWRPYLVQERHLGGRIIARTQPDKLAQFVSPEVAAAITNIMTEVTKRGTGTGAALSGVEVAGKTGTAETPPRRSPRLVRRFCSGGQAESSGGGGGGKRRQRCGGSVAFGTEIVRTGLKRGELSVPDAGESVRINGEDWRRRYGRSI